jgi:Glycosyl transferase family 2
MDSNTKTRLSVSVIIPTFNRAEFIAATIESLLAQTRLPDEIIVVDDGSNDDTPSILSRFGAPVVVVRQANGGEAAARNAGLDIARSDAVIFLDSDDRLVPHALERYLTTLEHMPHVGVAYADIHLCDQDMNHTGLYSREAPGRRPNGWVLGELACRSFLPVTSLVRRACVGEVRFERGMKCAADYDFWRQLAVRCQFQYVNEPLLEYRFHDGMVSSSHAVDMLAGELEVQRRILAMPEFAQLPRSIQARARCAHGIKNAMLGRTADARRSLTRALRTSPTYWGTYPLLALSLLSARALQLAILKRRQFAGNRMGTQAALNAATYIRGASPRPAHLGGVGL